MAVVPATAAPSELWGPPPTTSSPEINQHLAELTRALEAAARSHGTGPLERVREQAESYLRELRTEFLRHHRRLVVAARAEDGRAELSAQLRASRAELAGRFRGLVLERAGALQTIAFSPAEVIDAIDRLVLALPESITAPFEESTFEGSPDDPRPFGRRMLRARRGTRRAFGQGPLVRVVELRNLAYYHVGSKVPPHLEAVSAPLVQVDHDLAAHTRAVFDAIVRGYGDLADKMADPEADLGAGLRELHKSVDAVLNSAVDEIARTLVQGRHLAIEVLAEGMRALKGDVLVAGTLDLPPSEREIGPVQREREQSLAMLSEALKNARRNAAGAFALLAMELERIDFLADVSGALEEHVKSLESDVRGRAFVQAERVEAVLAEALARLRDALAGDMTGPEIEAEVRSVTDSVMKVAAEAAGVTEILVEQLSNEDVVKPLLEAIARVTKTLSERYDIVGPRRDGEPIEVPLRDIVTATVDATVHPKLVAATRQSADRVVPLHASLLELQRLMAFNVELATGELDAGEGDMVREETRTLLREMLIGSLERTHSLFQGYMRGAAHWGEDLGATLRSTVLDAISGQTGRLVSGTLTRGDIDAMRRAAAGRRLIREAERLPSRLARARGQLNHAVRALLGPDRLEQMRRTLGLPVPEGPRRAERADFAPPPVTEQVSLAYRRLFVADTIEASDVLTGREADIEHAVEVLTGAGTGRLGAVALVGMDGVGKATVSRAIVRASKFKNAQPITFTEPTGVPQLQALLAQVNKGQLVVLDGLQWLVAMKPDGFDPLRHLADAVLADGGKNAWLAQGDLLFWRAASSFALLEEAFATCIDLPPLDVEGLRSAVMARHGLSGFGIHFEPQSADSEIAGFVLRSAGRIRRPYERYFRLLHQASGGLVRDALRLWLASVKRIDEQEAMVHVGPVPQSPFAALLELPDELFLHLYQVARMGWMDAEVHALLFRVGRNTAEAHLARLHRLGLLEPHGPVFRVSTHLRGAVVRAVVEKGWLG